MIEAGTGLVSETWYYPLTYGDTLSNHDWFPMETHRLLGSRFVAHALAEGRRGDIGTALLLWCQAFKMDPAGTLPDDDVQLAQLAGFGPDVVGWQAVRAGVLYGWEPVVIDDAPLGATARLGHKTIAKHAVDMHRRKRGRDQARSAARVATMRSRVRAKLRATQKKHVWDNRQIVESVTDWLDKAGLYVTDDNVRMALVEAVGFTSDVVPLRGHGGGDG